MGLFESAKKQFIEVIEWTEPSDDILAYRFPVADNEIKNGAKLTVRESQAALLVDQGRPADQFAPGLHTLSTANLPVLTKLKSWPYGFTSPFKSEVYFFSLRQKLAQRWGTPTPINIRDKEFGSVAIRMFGIFSYHLSDPPTFYREVSGTRERYTTDELNQQIVGHIAAGAAAAFANSGVPFLDMAANQLQLGDALRQQLQDPCAKLGVRLDSFVVESVSLPEALQEALSQKQQMGIIGNDMGKFAQYQTAKSIPDAAKNPSGLAGIGAGIAAGVGFGNMMGNAMQGAGGTGGSAAPALVACVSCGKGIDDGSPFCRFCGTPQSRTCGKCGTKQAGDAAFCSKCGNKLQA
ncbi:MAG TPA: SPFH domain-containing protein [Myxococcales bacterium]|nr:SPFH domain-containing protein [Myxococcales bacterium]